jgi:hypothetical protein
MLLCLVLIIHPDILFMLFGIEKESAGIFIGRRTAMLFLGLSILTWVARNTAHSTARQAICLSIAISMLGLALLGIFEYLSGTAGIGILLAIVTEVTFALLYFKIWLYYKDVVIGLNTKKA